MKKLGCLLVLLLLMSVCASVLGCSRYFVSSDVPGFKRVVLKDEQSGHAPRDPRDLALTLAVIAVEYDIAFGVAPDLDHLVVIELPLDGDMTGATRDKGTIFIETNVNNPKLSATAIVHECVHLIFWRIEENPDDDHEVGPGPWTKKHNTWIEETEDRLAKMGL